MKYLRHNYIGDLEQVSRINQKVSKNDTLIMLGDIGDVSFMSKIKAGRKILILGNHDHGADHYKPYFDEVYEGILAISPKIILSHEPIALSYGLNIHGHTHRMLYTPDQTITAQRYIKDYNYRHQDINHLDIVAEKINYTPICLKDIINSGLLGQIPDIHRITIDQAIENTEKKEKNKHNGRTSN